jgi:hypothetical protein
MRCVVKLLNVQCILFKFDYCTLVIVHVAVIGSAEYGNHRRELLGTIPLVHLVAVELSFVGAQD